MVKKFLEEIIYIDGGSNDGSIELDKEFDGKQLYKIQKIEEP